MIIIHIAIALLSIISASVALFGASRRALTTSYALMAFTVASGTYLAVASQSNILHVCMSGLAYLAVIVALTRLAAVKLSLSSSHNL